MYIGTNFKPPTVMRTFKWLVRKNSEDISEGLLIGKI